MNYETLNQYTLVSIFIMLFFIVLVIYFGIKKNKNGFIISTILVVISSATAATFQTYADKAKMEGNEQEQASIEKDQESYSDDDSNSESESSDDSSADDSDSESDSSDESLSDESDSPGIETYSRGERIDLAVDNMQDKFSKIAHVEYDKKLKVIKVIPKDPNSFLAEVQQAKSSGDTSSWDEMTDAFDTMSKHLHDDFKLSSLPIAIINPLGGDEKVLYETIDGTTVYNEVKDNN